MELNGSFDILTYHNDVKQLKEDVDFIKKKIQKMSEMNESFSVHGEEFLVDVEETYNRTLKRVYDGIKVIGGCVCLITLKILFGEY